MIIVTYDYNGLAVSDFNVETTYRNIIKFMDVAQAYCFSTSPIFTRIRLGVVRGELDCNEIQFAFHYVDIPINEYGAIVNWPKGFCDSDIDMSEKIMKAAMKLRKSLKETRNA